MGAQIAAAAGEEFERLTNTLIGKITGLDPAKPCLREGQELSGLMKGNAKFVDIINTNPGVIGKKSPIGDVDFYPNG